MYLYSWGRIQSVFKFFWGLVAIFPAILASSSAFSTMEGLEARGSYNDVLPVHGLSTTGPLNIRTLGGMPEHPEAVVLRGQTLDTLLGAEVDSITVYAANALGEFRQIPFQIDERFNQSGELVLLPNALPGTGKFSENDELVFMARDAGCRIHPAKLSFHHQSIKEIELKDPKTGNKAWVYVVRSRIPLLKLPEGYVQYQPQERLVSAGSYFLSYEFSAPNQKDPYILWNPNHLSLSWEKNKGAENPLTPNLVRKYFFKVELASLGGLIDWQMDWKDFDPEEVGTRVGAIRAVRKIRLHPKIAMGISAKPVTIVQTFYDQYMMTQVLGDLAGIPPGFLSQMTVTFGEEYLEKYLPEFNVVSKGSEDLVTLRVSGSHGGNAYSYWRFVAEEEVRRAISVLAQGKDCRNCLRFQLDGKKLPGKPFQLTLKRFFPTQHSDSQIEAFLAMDDQPLEIKIQSVGDDLVFGRTR